MDRFFEKISKEEFIKSYDDTLYDEYYLPKRKTENSAGYDFIAIKDIIIEPGQIIKIPSGYKAKLNPNEVLLIFVRSSMGFKNNIRLINQVGIIDADYYNNEDNEGHIIVGLQNEGKETYVIKKGSAYAQGIFINYLTCNDIVTEKRIGGIGSTSKEEL